MEGRFNLILMVMPLLTKTTKGIYKHLAISNGSGRQMNTFSLLAFSCINAHKLNFI